jgi:hypothetical protein
MKFIEHHRDTGSECGTEIVYSKAYWALSKFENDVRAVEEALLDLKDANKKVADATRRKNMSEQALNEALHEHYEGILPSAMSTCYGTLILSGQGVSIIKTESYCDLYRVLTVGEEVQE